MNVSIVMTTINDGEVLNGYCQQSRFEGVSQSVTIFVIPDRKTPKRLYARCDELLKAGFRIKCPTLEEQDNYLKRLGVPETLIPYDSDNRRNIGYLMALEAGDPIMLSIDDDNYCIGPTYGGLSIVCDDVVESPTVNSSNGWFNFCDMLLLEPQGRFYPRGYPYHKRHRDNQVSVSTEGGPVRMNVGLWLQEPDLDAISWLTTMVRATQFRGESFLLGNNTWSPINTQNTALNRDLIITYYFVRMGYSLGGIVIDRYGDIFSGYLSQACVRHMGHRIRVGTPVAEHRRNAHNYLKDLTGELACILCLEDLTQWLVELELQGSSYAETYLCLADAIDAQVPRFCGKIWAQATQDYFHEMTCCMRQCVKACTLFS